MPLKHLVRINARSLPETTAADFEFRYLDIGSVGRGILLEEPQWLTFASAPSRARRLVAEGDTIISTVRTYLRAVLPVRAPASDLVVSTGFAVLTPGPSLAARYLGWLAQSDPVVEEVVARSTGVSYPAINAGEIGELRVALLPLRIQIAIADFLDAETARIDALIAAERRLAQAARERRDASVQRLVLGREEREVRVNDHAGPCFPTPAGWAHRRNKTFMRERNELSQTGEEELLTVSHLTGVTRRSDKEVTMFLAESTIGYKLVEPGDVVVNTLWAWMGALGVAHHRGIVSPAYGVYRFTESAVDERYFDALFRSPAYVTEMTRHSKGVWTSRLRLYPESFLGLMSPFPSLRAQQSIGDAVATLHYETDRVVARLDRATSLLQERRQALITAAVTGQIDIPGVAA